MGGAWAATGPDGTLTYLQWVLHGPHAEQLVPSLEFICTAIGQAWIQPGGEEEEDTAPGQQMTSADPVRDHNPLGALSPVSLPLGKNPELAWMELFLKLYAGIITRGRFSSLLLKLEKNGTWETAVGIAALYLVTFGEWPDSLACRSSVGVFMNMFANTIYTLITHSFFYD